MLARMPVDVWRPVGDPVSPGRHEFDWPLRRSPIHYGIEQEGLDITKYLGIGTAVITIGMVLR